MTKERDGDVRYHLAGNRSDDDPLIRLWVKCAGRSRVGVQPPTL